MSDDKELRECPFCGGTIASYRVTKDKLGEIVCPQCQATFNFEGVHCLKDVRDAWNRRIPTKRGGVDYK